MKFNYSKAKVSLGDISYRSMGFGEDVSLPREVFVLEIDLKDLPVSFIKKADGFISQCEIDDKEQGYPDIPEVSDLNYKPFAVLMRDDPKVASFLVKDYLYMDFLDELFKFTRKPKIVINKIFSVAISCGKINLIGEAFESKEYLIFRLRRRKNMAMKNGAHTFYN